MTYFLLCLFVVAVTLIGCGTTSPIAVQMPPVTVSGPGDVTATVSSAGTVLSGPAAPIHVGGVTITPSAPVTVTVSPSPAATP